MNICTEFEEPMSILCQVIIWTRFGLYIIKLKATVTLNFDGLISKSIGIIYTPGSNLYSKFDEPRSFLCLVNMRTRLTCDKVWSIYQNNIKVTMILNFYQITSKSIGIIYNLTHMSVSNLTNLGQFCV